MKLTLKELCSGIFDCEHKTAPLSDFGFPSIRTPNIGKGRLILEGVNLVSEETYKDWTKRAIPEFEDLVLAREAPAGNVAIIPKNLKICLGQRTVLIKPDKNKVIPNFLCYYLLSPKMQQELLSKSAGSTVAHINVKDIKDLNLFIIPPLPTQRRIASILSAYDDLIENNLKRIRLLEESLQIIQNKLSTETDSNPSLIYPEIADFEKGFEPGSNSYIDEYSNGLIPFIRVGDLNSRESKLYINSELKGIKMSQSDDILISMDGSIGIVSVGINGAYSSGIRKVALKNRFLKGLIYAFLKSPTGQSQIMTFAKGSTILHASSCIPKLKVIIPNEIKYKNEFELANSCLDQIIKLISQNKILKESRDILLPRLMSEKINVE